MVDDHSEPNELRKESYNLVRMECYMPAYPPPLGPFFPIFATMAASSQGLRRCLC